MCGSYPMTRALRTRLSFDLRLGESLDVLEDTATSPETPRIFIAPARAPYPGFAVLDDFRQPVIARCKRTSMETTNTGPRRANASQSAHALNFTSGPYRIS